MNTKQLLKSTILGTCVSILSSNVYASYQGNNLSKQELALVAQHLNSQESKDLATINKKSSQALLNQKESRLCLTQMDVDAVFHEIDSGLTPTISIIHIQDETLLTYVIYKIQQKTYTFIKQIHVSSTKQVYLIN